jgi:hypothetical protein
MGCVYTLLVCRLCRKLDALHFVVCSGPPQGGTTFAISKPCAVPLIGTMLMERESISCPCINNDTTLIFHCFQSQC